MSPKQPAPTVSLATATAPDGSTVGDREAGWAAQPAADEFARLEPDREFLKTLASKTGGEVVDGDQTRRVRRQPLLAHRADHRAVDVAPVASTPLFLIAIICLTAEWGSAASTAWLETWRKTPTRIFTALPRLGPQRRSY